MLVSHVDGYAELCRYVGVAAGVREDNVHYGAWSAQSRRDDLYRGKRFVSCEGSGRVGVNSGIPHSEVVQSSVLVGGSRVVGHMYNAIKQFRCCSGELCLADLIRARNGIDQSI